MAVFRVEIPYCKIDKLDRFVPDELKDRIESGAISRRPVSTKKKGEVGPMPSKAQSRDV